MHFNNKLIGIQKHLLATKNLILKKEALVLPRASFLYFNRYTFIVYFLLLLNDYSCLESLRVVFVIRLIKEQEAYDI